MDNIALTLIGPVHLAVGSRHVALPRSGKVTALLAFLAVDAAKVHRREALAQLFWPEMEGAQALQNLRQTLLLLRKLVGDTERQTPWVQTDRSSVRLNPSAAQFAWVDVPAFMQPVFSPPAACTPGFGRCAACLAAARPVVDLYQGEFLQGFGPELQLEEFSHWVEIERRYLHRRALALFDQMRQCEERLGDLDRAAEYAARAVRLEPLDEGSVRALMRLEKARGNTSAALSLYARLDNRLRLELDIAPAPETTALYESLIDRQESGPEPAAEAWVERPVTVLACRLPASPDQKPQQRAAHARAAWQTAAALLRAAEAHLQRGTGDAVLAYFGYPAAREHATRDALDTAWKLLDAPVTRNARIGIHTGGVIAAEEEGLPDLVGTTTAVAQALAARARPGEILVSAAAEAIASRYFPFETVALEPDQDGIASPTARALAPRAASAAATPLVGRDEELAWLCGHWAAACAGEMRSVLIAGEPGIGKTRLVLGLIERLATEELAVRRLECREASVHCPLQPVIGMLRATFALDAADPPDLQLACIEGHLDRYALETAQVMPLLAELLSLPLPAHSHYRRAELPAAIEREMLLRLLVRLLAEQCARQPVLLWVEDVHWADPSTFALVRRAAAQLTGSRLFIVLTSRPAPTVATLAREGLETRTLEPLRPEAAARLAVLLARDTQLPDSVARIIAGRAEGVPLFIEELVRSRIGGGVDSAAATPASLRELLCSRLDGIAAQDRRLLRTAAVLGRHFDPAQLAALAQIDPSTLVAALRRLTAAGIVRHLREPADLYEFTHALIHETTYDYCTAAQRRALHLRAAEAITSRFGPFAEARPDVVAHHFEAGGALAPAIDGWMRAAQRSAGKGADVEAIAQFERARALLGGIDDARKRDALELEILLLLGVSQSAVEGFASPAVRATWQRALLLGQGTEDRFRLFRTVGGLFLAMMYREENYAATEQLALDMQRIAAAADNPLLHATASLALGLTWYWQGRYAEAEAELQRVEQFSPEESWPLQQRYFLFVLPVPALDHRALSLWALGRDAEASRVAGRADAIARRVNDPRTSAGHLMARANLHHQRGDLDKLAAVAREAADLAQRHGFGFWELYANAYLDLAAAHRGDAAAVDRLAERRGAMVTMMQSPIAYSLNLLIDAAIAAGRYDQALALCEEGIAVAENGDRLHAIEFRRYRGEVLARLGCSEQARAAWAAALDLAEREPRAPTLAARAARSLACSC